MNQPNRPLPDYRVMAHQEFEESLDHLHRLPAVEETTADPEPPLALESEPVWEEVGADLADYFGEEEAITDDKPLPRDTSAS